MVTQLAQMQLTVIHTNKATAFQELEQQFEWVISIELVRPDVCMSIDKKST
jgi:hypothetical protein